MATKSNVIKKKPPSYITGLKAITNWFFSNRRKKEELENALIDATKDYYQNLCEQRKNTPKVALVLGRNKAYYYGVDKEVTFNASIPSGGVLLAASGQIIAKNTSHYIQL